MPSNKDLTEQINQLSEKLQIPVDLDGLSNADLNKLLSDLKAKARDADNATQADDADGADGADGADNDTQADDAAEPKGVTVVAKGKAITSGAGLLTEGQEVKPEYLPGGATRIAELVAAGICVEA